MPTDWWFADSGDVVTEAALVTCRSRPVAAECFEAAIVEECVGWSCYGIRGGSTASTSRRLVNLQF
jgi:hypothetical protein